MRQKRKHVRIPISAPMHGLLKFTSKIKDVSISGCLVETAAPLSDGAVLDIEFALPNTARMVRAKAEVRWSGHYTSEPRTDLSGGIGLRFVELSPEDSATIGEFVQDRATQLRTFGRANISIPIVYSEEPQPPNLKAEALDISLGGLFIRTEQIPALDQELSMEFTLPGESDPICCSGKVAYLNQDIPEIFVGMIHSGMGVEFSDIKDEDLEKIEHALENPL
jgi:Tfp pilus assembly protein PilZ